MALTIYPDVNADSFVSLAQAELYISMLTLEGVAWAALDPLIQENYLRIAYRDIVDHTDPTTYPTPFPLCVGEAQALMASYDLQYGISSTQTATTGAIKKNKVGSIEQEFYDVQGQVKDAVSSRVPSMALPCLAALGYNLPSSGLQTRLGRS